MSDLIERLGDWRTKTLGWGLLVTPALIGLCIAALRAREGEA